jgi:hypothetical protein
MIAGGWGRDRIGWLGMNWDETGGAEGPGIAEIDVISEIADIGKQV